MGKNNGSNTWRIGELAEMFGVNVQLLRHYDKEGLLVPEIRNPNNKWRSYNYDQIYPLGMIRLLRHLDCSLDDIGEFLPQRHPDSTREYLTKRMEIMRSKYEKLLKTESVLLDRFDMVDREMKYAVCDQPFVSSEQDICYIEIGGIEEIFVDEMFYLYPTLVFYRGEEKSFAVRIPADEKAAFEKYSSRMHTVELGNFLMAYHQGPYEKIYETFDSLRAAAEGLLDEGCSLEDTEICMDLVDRFIESDNNNFVTKVMIKINREEYTESR